ncbi:MAG: hypothetical protein K0S07_364 [Chlamydiales bacterium]|jgi:hypothetical protein|nr:hypothetical protein [Chlamydiales bacterium]
MNTENNSYKKNNEVSPLPFSLPNQIATKKGSKRKSSSAPSSPFADQTSTLAQVAIATTDDSKANILNLKKRKINQIDEPASNEVSAKVASESLNSKELKVEDRIHNLPREIQLEIASYFPYRFIKIQRGTWQQPLDEKRFAKCLDRLQQENIYGLNLDSCSPMQLKMVLEHPIMSKIHCLQLNLDEVFFNPRYQQIAYHVSALKHLMSSFSQYRSWQSVQFGQSAFEIITPENEEDGSVLFNKMRQWLRMRPDESHFHLDLHSTIENLAIPELKNLRFLQVKVEQYYKGIPFRLLEDLLKKTSQLEAFHWTGRSFTDQWIEEDSRERERVNVQTETHLTQGVIEQLPSTLKQLHLEDIYLELPTDAEAIYDSSGSMHLQRILDRLPHLEDLSLAIKDTYCTSFEKKHIAQLYANLECLTLSNAFAFNNANPCSDPQRTRTPLAPNLKVLNFRFSSFNSIKELENILIHCPKLERITFTACALAQENTIYPFFASYPGQETQERSEELKFTGLLKEIIDLFEHAGIEVIVRKTESLEWPVKNWPGRSLDQMHFKELLKKQSEL